MITVITGDKRSGKTTLAVALAKQIEFDRIDGITYQTLGSLTGVLVLDNCAITRVIKTEQGITIRCTGYIIHPDTYENTRQYIPRGIIEIDDLGRMMKQYKHTILVMRHEENVFQYFIPDYVYHLNHKG